MDDVQKHQSDQYVFPYHYLPEMSSDATTFTTSRPWGFSLSYVTALQHVVSTLRRLDSNAHIDIGCGDGALVHHLSRRLPGMVVAGIDYDQRAIDWARMFTPQAAFWAGDLRMIETARRWDTASLIEVIEHIPPTELASFIEAVRRMLPIGARLIATVPHRNKPVSSKHYQHFSFDHLRTTLAPHFRIEDIFGFEFTPPGERLYRRLLANRWLHVDSPVINRWRLAGQIKRRDDAETACGRIFTVATAI